MVNAGQSIVNDGQFVVNINDDELTVGDMMISTIRIRTTPWDMSEEIDKIC